MIIALSVLDNRGRYQQQDVRDSVRLHRQCSSIPEKAGGKLQVLLGVAVAEGAWEVDF